MNNNSSSIPQLYLFLPVSNYVRACLYSVIAFFGIYAVFVNGLILYLTRNRKLKGRRLKPFERHYVTYIFTTSLAASNIACATISLPLSIVTNFVDILDTDLKCQLVRFSFSFFLGLSVSNVSMITMERYLAIFHPFRVPSVRGVKISLVSAWLLAVPIAILPSVTCGLRKHEIGPNRYTMECKSNHSTSDPLHVAFQYGFALIVYIIPTVVLSFANIRILLYLKRSKLLTSERRGLSWRFYGTSSFAVLTLTFVLPCAAVFVMTFFKPTSLTLDYLTRKSFALFMYSNTGIGPTILVLTLPGLRRLFLNLFSAKKNVAGRRNVICAVQNEFAINRLVEDKD